MTVADAIMEYLGNCVTRLENEQLNRTQKMGDLKREITALETAQLAGQRAIARAEAGLPSLDICPHCWIEGSLRSRLVNGSPEEVGEEIASDHEVLRCERRHVEGIRCQWYAIVGP